MSISTSSSAAPRPSMGAINRQIVTVVIFNFVCYLSVGLPLAVLPGYVLGLGYGAVWAGGVISTHYLATLVSRAYAGRMADGSAKRSVLIGLGACGLSGALLLLAGFVASQPLVCLGVLFLSRIALGFGESWVATGAIMWAIGRVGPGHTARVISWNGMTSYGGIAIAAPIGVTIAQFGGLSAVGVTIILLTVFALLFACGGRPTPAVVGKAISFGQVFRRVAPNGLGLALAAVGFGTIATFITLYYARQHWTGPAYALSAFGTAFIGARLLFQDRIARHGGFKVAIICLGVEVLGLTCLWLATGPVAALIGTALTGLGFALVFPALGVEVIDLVPGPSRGAALGAFMVFFDLSLGISGPVAGVIANRFGYSTVFLWAALSAVTGLALTIVLYRQRQARPLIDGVPII